MNERKYVIRRLASLPGSGLRVLYEKGKAHIIASSIILAILVAGLIVIFSVLSVDDRDKAIKAIVGGLMNGGVLALITVGMVVFYKATRIFNMAHGGMLLFLTYLTWWLIADQGVPYPLVLFLVAIAGVVLGWVLDRALFRGMIGHGELSSFLITMILGFSVLHYITKLIFEGKDRVMPDIIGWILKDIFQVEGGTVHVIGTYNLPWAELGSFIVATLMFLIFVTYFRFTKSGLAMRCVSEDNIISQSLGIKVKRIYTIAWIIGCLSAVTGGILLASVVGTVYSSRGGMDGLAIMMALPIVVLGGLESIAGAYVAALIIGLTVSLCGFYVDSYIRGFADVVPWVLLMVVMIIRPSGLFGVKGIKRI